MGPCRDRAAERRLRRAAFGVAAALALAVPGAMAGEARAAQPPAGCVAVPTGADLRALLDAAAPGDAFCLAPGSWPGPLRLDRRVTLWGPREAVVVSRGTGTTVALDGDGAALLGLTVDGSGGRFDLLDAAVRVRADDVRVEGVRIRGALFGILVEQSHRVVLRGNEVEGAPGKALGLRGDGIRLWEVRDSRIEDNRVSDSRDVVVWYSPGNRFRGNEVVRGRYGTHFMYSHGNVLEDGLYDANVVGVFVMYSREIALRRNLVVRSHGSAGVGLGAKDSGDLEVVDNVFLGNTTGLYLDTSPLDPQDHNVLSGNLLRFSDTAVIFHGVVDRNHFQGNGFADNRVQVAVEGRGDATAAEWRGNHWDDYAGYDLDDDGRGDLPYRLRSLSSELTARVPALAFFRGGMAMALVELVGRAVPLFEPETILVDPAPRMAPVRAGAAGAG